MNLLDLGIVIVLALIVLRGYYRGLFQELAVLAGLVGGLLAAAHFYLLLAARLQPLIQEPTYARWLAFAVILVAVYWLTRVLAHFLQRLLYHLYLDVFDRLLGALFALLKGGLVVGFALMIVSVAIPKSQLIKESRAAPVLLHLARQALEFLPADFKKQWEKQLRDWLKPKEKQQAFLHLTFSPIESPLRKSFPQPKSFLNKSICCGAGALACKIQPGAAVLHGFRRGLTEDHLHG